MRTKFMFSAVPPISGSVLYRVCKLRIARALAQRAPQALRLMTEAMHHEHAVRADALRGAHEHRLAQHTVLVAQPHAIAASDPGVAPRSALSHSAFSGITSASSGLVCVRLKVWVGARPQSRR